MHVRLSIFIAAALIALCGAARAQEYGSRAPVPATTSVPALRAVALTREIKMRFILGLDADKRNDWAAAVPEFERILQIANGEPERSTAAYDLARSYAGLRRYDDAARALKSAIAADPEFLAAYANLIAIDLTRGDFKEAKTFANRFLALAPDSARALYSRGLVALQTGDSATAIADFGKLLEADPSYAVAHYDLGIAETRSNRFGEAQREFETAVRLAPSYARARFALATVLLKAGHKLEARAALDAAIRDSTSDPVLRNLAAALRAEIK
ncbi:MAG: tetratricopeptide repeat protein [Candidatus Eremiobacteraeota bacterium]|nr:tetratricopeptide repeat protein [Candidatus Eremiobacteraeota bacterium]